MNYDESEDYADKVIKYEKIIKELREENTKLKEQRQLDIKELQDLSFALIDMHDDAEQWQRESISDKSKLGLLRIWLAENELDLDDVVKKIEEQVK